MSERTTERPGSLVESHKGYDPRLILFYFGISVLLLTLAGGLTYQQLLKTDSYHDKERMQNQRRILTPGPRGNIYDRNGNLLVGNRPRFAVTLNLDELRPQFKKEFVKIRNAYRETDDRNLPTPSELDQVARFTVVQRYLDQVNKSLNRAEELDGQALTRHYRQQLLLPYVLVDDLHPEEYAKLIEQLPVTSPLQVYTSTTRHYPYGSAAAHTLGFVGTVNLEDSLPEGLPGDELKTFAMKGTAGRDGLELKFDDRLQGETGGTIYRVDPAGYRVNPPLHKRLPVQGNNLVTSLDIDFQTAVESAMATIELPGAAVALDVATGEVLVLASKPDFNLSDTAPRISSVKYKEIDEAGGWYNRAVKGTYAPGSTFKIITALAGLRNGVIDPEAKVTCNGAYKIGRRLFPCHDGHAHGEINLATAIEQSCNVYFFEMGVKMGPDLIAAEARRFRFDRPTGIELPYETKGMLVPDPAWKRRITAQKGLPPDQQAIEERWYEGNTANYAIGQGFLLVTPLQMACFAASFARGETETIPTLLHQPDRPRQSSAPLGLTPEQHQAILLGMEQCVISPHGTARILNTPALRIPDLRIAGKTGTAQVATPKGTINLAWFICFAPVERPEIAIAVMIEGDTPGEELAGGRYAGPVAHAILKKWWEKKKAAPVRTLTVSK
ncbi:MAG: peptidoglycan glycosyltransferase [Opitutaceae bacterium]|nr:peptidoglycan glycosyltransferase [Opitutaceae bacterium]